ncbi:MAG: hypothetical protein AB8G96_03290 [Phycisphaerales bacterium]
MPERPAVSVDELLSSERSTAGPTWTATIEPSADAPDTVRLRPHLDGQPCGGSISVPKQAIRSVRPTGVQTPGRSRAELVHVDFDRKASVRWDELFASLMADAAATVDGQSATHARPGVGRPGLSGPGTPPSRPAPGRISTMNLAQGAAIGLHVDPVTGVATALPGAGNLGSSPGAFAPRMCVCNGQRMTCCEWIGWPIGFMCEELPIRCGVLS